MSKVLSIPLDPAALRKGYRAGRRGITADAIPYPVGTREALAWGIGWVTGQRQQLRVVDGGRSPKTYDLAQRRRGEPLVALVADGNLTQDSEKLFAFSLRNYWLPGSLGPGCW